MSSVFQVRLSELSREQEQREEAYYAAAKILRAAGFNVEVVKCFVSSPTEDPAYLRLRKLEESK